MYDMPVDIAAPLQPNRGTSIVFPIMFVTHAEAAISICILLFFIKEIPVTVVSEMVYIMAEYKLPLYISRLKEKQKDPYTKSRKFP